MISALNTALQGLQSNQQALAHHADRISKAGQNGTGSSGLAGPVNLTTEMVGIIQAQRGFEANLPVVRAADEMLGSLLDALA